MTTRINSKNGFAGMWPDLLTPFQANFAIHLDKFAAHAKNMLAAGCAGVAVFGHAGEGASLGLSERIAALDHLVTSGVPADALLVHASFNAVTDAIHLIEHGRHLGVHGHVVSPPSYFKGLSDVGLTDYFLQLIAGAGVGMGRLYLHHIPQTVTVDVTHPVIAQLIRAHPEVIAGVIDQGGNATHTNELLRAFNATTSIFTGSEEDLLAMGTIGSPGATCGLANIMPRATRRLVIDPKGMSIVRDRQRTGDMLHWMAHHPRIESLKFLLSLVYQDPDWARVRGPLTHLNKDTQTDFVKVLKAFELDKAHE